MNKTIVNRVSNSSLVTIDLEEIRLKGVRSFFDLKTILDQGVILRENKIRDFIKVNDWSKYSNQFVAIGCSSDAILPSWAKLLIAASLKPYAKKIVIGSLEQLETVLFECIINELDFTKYTNKPVIVKGCSDSSIPDSAYGFLINKLQGIAKKISYGEACSSVPLWKSNK
jgi:hypothetical protein|tara:strand:- start:1731 stop:2240 length:510 start_codon:yes stop_codon:yes gene_type:complete